MVMMDPFQKIRFHLAWKHSSLYRFFILAAFVFAIPVIILPDLFSMHFSKTIKIILIVLLSVFALFSEVLRSMVVKKNKDEYELRVKEAMPQIKDARKLDLAVLAIIGVILLVVIFVLNL